MGTLENDGNNTVFPSVFSSVLMTSPPPKTSCCQCLVGQLDTVNRRSAGQIGSLIDTATAADSDSQCTWLLVAVVVLHSFLLISSSAALLIEWASGQIVPLCYR